MKPTELYARQPEEVSHDLQLLRGVYFDHVPEVKHVYDTGDLIDAARRVEIRVYKDFHFDTRRIWRLASVWFDGAPVMVIQNAGREGDDHHARFITDQKAYAAMVAYLLTLPSKAPPDGEINPETVDSEQDIPALTEFYGERLDGHFQRSRY